MSHLQATFEAQASKCTVLVVGDLMLDHYIWGKVNRISPEAPVPVVDIREEEGRPGGAANVGLNVRAMGAEVLLAGLVGQDQEKESLANLLAGRGFGQDMLFPVAGRRTTTKVRIMAQGQQLMRVDKEDRGYPDEAVQRKLADRLVQALDQARILLFQDYDKGMLSPSLIRTLIQAANAKGIPVIVDPKSRQFWEYSDCTLFKPNLKELREGLNRVLEGDAIDDVHEAVMELRERMPHRSTLITLSEHGMLYVDEAGAAHHVPAHVRKIADVSGAGDTVISVMAVCLGIGLRPKLSVRLANLAGGLVCEEAGVVPVNLTALFEHLHQEGLEAVLAQELQRLA